MKQTLLCLLSILVILGFSSCQPTTPANSSSNTSSSSSTSTSILGTWKARSSTTIMTGHTLSNIVATFTSGHCSLTYTDSSQGASSQSGTITPVNPISGDIITYIALSGSGFWPGNGSYAYYRASNVTSSTMAFEYSMDETSWTSMGTFDKQ